MKIICNVSSFMQCCLILNSKTTKYCMHQKSSFIYLHKRACSNDLGCIYFDVPNYVDTYLYHNRDHTKSSNRQCWQQVYSSNATLVPFIYTNVHVSNDLGHKFTFMSQNMQKFTCPMKAIITMSSNRPSWQQIYSSNAPP